MQCVRKVHPSQALKSYSQKRRRKALLVTCRYSVSLHYPKESVLVFHCYEVDSVQERQNETQIYRRDDVGITEVENSKLWSMDFTATTLNLWWGWNTWGMLQMLRHVLLSFSKIQWSSK